MALQHAHELLAGQRRADQAGEHLGQAEAGDRGVDDGEHVVQDHAAVDVELQLAQVTLEVAAAERPPVRVPIGADAFARVEAKNAAVAAELAAWREVAAVRGFAG